MLVGAYELLRRLETRNPSTREVWLGRLADSRLSSEEVVCKCLRDDEVDELRRYLADAARAMDLQHPNIVSTLEILDDHSRIWVVQEHVQGATLAELAGWRLSIPMVARIGLHVAKALDHAHRLRHLNAGPVGFPHGSIRADKVLVGCDGSVRVVDFGLSPSSLAASRLDERMVANAKARDLYAFGLIMRDLLTEQGAFPPERAATEFGRDLSAFIERVTSEPRPNAMTAREVYERILDCCPAGADHPAAGNLGALATSVYHGSAPTPVEEWNTERAAVGDKIYAPSDLPPPPAAPPAPRMAPSLEANTPSSAKVEVNLPELERTERESPDLPTVQRSTVPPTLVHPWSSTALRKEPEGSTIPRTLIRPWSVRPRHDTVELPIEVARGEWPRRAIRKPRPWRWIAILAVIGIIAGGVIAAVWQFYARPSILASPSVAPIPAPPVTKHASEHKTNDSTAPQHKLHSYSASALSSAL